MKRNRATCALATIAVVLSGLLASAAEGADAYWLGDEPMGDSSPGTYSSYLADDAALRGTAAEPGFTGSLDDEELSPAAGSDVGWKDEYHRDACPDCYGNCGGVCGSRMWVGVDYLLLWTKGRELPPLITTGAPGEDGVLGFPSTTILYGGEEIGEDFRSAGRFSLGFWLDDCERLGLGARMLLSETDESNFAAASNANGLPVLARPFYNTDLIANFQDSLIIARPGVRRGSIDADAANDLMSVDAYLRVLLYQCDNRRLDLLAGYQFSRIDDSLNIHHRMVQLGGDYSPGTQFAFADLFDARNSFHGGSLGLQGEYTRGGLTLAMISKLGFGNMREEVQISGSSTVIDPQNNRADFQGGMLALPSNIGTYKEDSFVFVPEVELKLLYQVTSRLDVSVGYSFLYWSDVALAGGQIDTSVANTPTVNGSQLLGGTLAPGAPANPLRGGIDDAGFWAQGLSFGVSFKR